MSQMISDKPRTARVFNPDKNVLEAARERIEYIFDNFENIIVSISGGKDSEVVAHLALTEAVKRGRKIGLFFLDEEVMYKSTIEMVEYLMGLFPENTVRYWLQIQFNLANSASLLDSQLRCWAPEKKPVWMHKRSEKNVLHRTWSHDTIVHNKNKGFGFYDALYNFELGFNNTAFLVGLRADESLNRYRAMVKNPGFKDVYWSTARDGGTNFTFYPIYDWGFHDVWKYIGDNKLKYHKFYDFAHLKGMNINEIRVSSLTHEQSFKSIQNLPEFEPDTYERLLKRLGGISFVQETAKDKKMFRVQKLPKNYSTWKEYRDFLLKTHPIPEHAEIYKRRFARYKDNEYVYKQECKQLILNDIENTFPIKNTEDPVQEKIAHWRSVL